MANQLTGFSDTEINIPSNIVNGIASGMGGELGSFALDKLFEFAGVDGSGGMSDLLNNILDKLNKLQETLDNDFQQMMDKLNTIILNQDFADIKPLIDMNSAAFGPGYIPDVIDPDKQANAEPYAEDLVTLLESCQIGKACDTWHSTLYGDGFKDQGYISLLIQQVSIAPATKVLSSLAGGTAEFFDHYWAYLDVQQAVTLLLWAQYTRYKTIGDKYKAIIGDPQNSYYKDPLNSPDFKAAVAAVTSTVEEKISQYKMHRKLQLSKLRGMLSPIDTRPLDVEVTPINHLPPGVIIDKTTNRMWYSLLSGRLAINIRISDDCNIPADQANPLGEGNPPTMTQKDSAGIVAYVQSIVDKTCLKQWKVPDDGTLRNFINGRLGGQIGVGAGGDFFLGVLKGYGFSMTEEIANTIWTSKFDYGYLKDYNTFANRYYAFLEANDWRDPTMFEEGCMLMLYRDIPAEEAELYWY